MSDLQHPTPLALADAAKEVHTIAAPLLTAAALSLAGVVAGAAQAFLWPGPTLLLLVAASLLLVASIQLHYHSRQYLYTRADIDDWMPPDSQRDAVEEEVYKRYCAWQGDDFRKWLAFQGKSVFCFNFGTILLGLGVAVALLPGDHVARDAWRLVAALMVLAGVAVDAMWIARLYRRREDLSNYRGMKLREIRDGRKGDVGES